jgi:hypothetical protein
MYLGVGRLKRITQRKSEKSDKFFYFYILGPGEVAHVLKSWR